MGDVTAVETQEPATSENPKRFSRGERFIDWLKRQGKKVKLGYATAAVVRIITGPGDDIVAPIVTAGIHRQADVAKPPNSDPIPVIVADRAVMANGKPPKGVLDNIQAELAQKNPNNSINGQEIKNRRATASTHLVSTRPPSIQRR